VTALQGARRDVPERARAYDSVTTAKDPLAADVAADLVSLRFVGAALRRRAWLWCAIAVAGLLIGLGIYVVFPPAYQASTTILLTQISSGNSSPVTALKPPDAMQSAVVMLQSRTVAERTMHELGLQQSVDSFLAAETVTPVTARILTLTVSALSSDEAVQRANALAAEFLRFRAEQLYAEQNLWFTTLNQDISQAWQRVARLAGQAASKSAQAKSPAFRELQARRREANSLLAGLQQTLLSYQATTTSAIQGSGVLDPAAPIPRTPRALNAGVRLPIRYAVTGLIPGLALGLGLVIVLELASDRLRRREDIARALGAPVGLSVGSALSGRWRPGRRGLAAVRSNDIQHIVAYLRDNLPEASHGAAALAVVAVENAQLAASLLVSLARSCAQEGQQVVVADLSVGAHAAHLLGAGDPGVRALSLDGAHLVVAVPNLDDLVPVGPVRRASPQAQSPPSDKTLTAAYVSADILLTLVCLDPLLGAEHLATWATDAVVVVTAGRSSSRRLHAVGEMIRLAGTRLVSAVLVGVDNTDESLGTVQAPRPPAPVNPGPFLAVSPAPAHRPNKRSRPGRGLHLGFKANGHDNPFS
jgi:capsular polysaccharide biosynthesis protein